MTSTIEETLPNQVTSAPVTASPVQAVHPAIAAGARPVETVTQKPQPTVAVQASPDATAPAAATGVEDTVSPAASPAVQPVTTAGATVHDPEQTPSFAQRLKGEDRHWAWKVALRTLQCILCLVGIGCCAWIIVSAVHIEDYDFYSRDFNTDRYMTKIAIPMFLFSILWGITDLLVRLCRKPPRPIHPAVTLSIDLCFWLTFILPILACIIAYIEIDYVGTSGYNGPFIPDPSSSYGRGYQGQYYLNQTTDTWIYNITYVSSSVDREYNYTSGEWYYPKKTDPSSIVRTCSYDYRSCAEQDATINALWKQKPTRLAVVLVVAVMLGLAALCHFQLFVWACVDTHKWRVDRKQAAITKSIEGMLATGQLVFSPGVTGPLVMRPSPAYMPAQVYTPAQAFPPAMQQTPPATTQQSQGLSPPTGSFWSRQQMVPPPQKHDASAKAAFFAYAILPINSVKKWPLSEWASFVSMGWLRSTAPLGGSGDNRDGSCMVRPKVCLLSCRLFADQAVGADRIVWALKSLPGVESASLAEV
ncbi:hypothetical protein PspLS_06898 [Pyricularia sp. CBS 133598]|nr:hypothetical protein PspLS_06898 [Pyricularia sp. CBS 133598]